jgi:hypothetical protein
MAAAAASESRTLRIRFSLGFGRSGDEGNPAQPGKFLKLADVQQNTLTTLNCPWGSRSSGVHPIPPVAASRRGGPETRVGGPTLSGEGPPQDRPSHRTHDTAVRRLSSSVTMPVVVPVMMVVVSVVTVMVVMMMVVMMAPPHHAAVAVARAPVMVADPEPGHVVDHVGVPDGRLHRRRRDDSRIRVRRHQRGARHGHRRGSQAQKQLAHLGTSPLLSPTRDSTRAIPSRSCLAYSEPVQRHGNIAAAL